jgi:hypothetical protein
MSKKRKRAASLSQEDIVFVFLSARVVCGNQELLGDLKLSVGFAPRGHVSAKLHASNNNQFVLCKPSWKILFGFHCTVQDWKKTVKGPWSRCVHRCKDDWETSIREGLKLAFRYCDDQTVYVSSEARSCPESPLLRFMQGLCTKTLRKTTRTSRKRKRRKQESLKHCFWRLVLSKKNIHNISKELKLYAFRS